MSPQAGAADQRVAANTLRLGHDGGNRLLTAASLLEQRTDAFGPATCVSLLWLLECGAFTRPPATNGDTRAVNRAFNRLQRFI